MSWLRACSSRGLAGLLCVLASWAQAAHTQDAFTIGDDGSVRCVRTQGATLVFRFGFATNTAAKVWHDGAALRRQWTISGIRYTQTVLRRDLPPRERLGEQLPRPGEVILINIQGENTNTEYTEARADLAVETGAKRSELELADGLVWEVQGATRRMLAALESPEPGVKTKRGEQLRFQGNMPPSEKGSMTLKVPLTELRDQDLESLSEIDFVESLAKALKRNG